MKGIAKRNALKNRCTSGPAPGAQCPMVNGEQPRRGHFHWPDINVDLTEAIIEHPERFPLKAG